VRQYPQDRIFARLEKALKPFFFKGLCGSVFRRENGIKLTGYQDK